jgi:hypothetical protein
MELHHYAGELVSGTEKYFTEQREYAAKLTYKPVHVMWGCAFEKDLEFAIASFRSLQFYSPRKIIPHFVCIFEIENIIKKRSLYKEFDIRFVNPSVFVGWDCGKFTYAVFTKIIAPFIFRDIDRLLLYDNDIISQRDISCLYDMELDGFPYAAQELDQREGWIEWKIKMGIRHHGGAVVLCDCEKIREQLKSTEEVAKAAKHFATYGIQNKPISHFAEEELWGILFKNNWKSFPKSGQSWNPISPLNTQKAVHFHGEYKPFSRKIVFDGKTIYDGGGQEFVVKKKNPTSNIEVIGRNYPEWVAHLDFSKNEERIENFCYSGCAAARDVGLRLLGFPNPLFGKEFRANRNIKDCGKYYKRGEIIVTSPENQELLMMRGLLSPILP